MSSYYTQSSVSSSGAFTRFQPERELDHNLTSGNYELVQQLSKENRNQPFLVRNPRGSGQTITLVLLPWGNAAADTVTREIAEGEVYDTKIRRVISSGSTQTTIHILY